MFVVVDCMVSKRWLESKSRLSAWPRREHGIARSGFHGAELAVALVWEIARLLAGPWLENRQRNRNLWDYSLRYLSAIYCESEFRAVNNIHLGVSSA